MIAEIIAAGSEMLTPYRQDTNSLWLTGELNALGISVAFKTIVGDDIHHLTDAARIALQRADIVIFSGGLGPTEDDLTREAVASALQLKLLRDSKALAAITERFRSRGMSMRSINEKQADVIAGAEVLPNANGTAPGQWLAATVDGKLRYVALLPGPPKELTALFAEQVRERLRAVAPEQHIATASLRMAVIGESEVDARTAPIYKSYTDVQTTILSTQGEIQLHFLCAKPTTAEAQARVDELSTRCAAEVRDYVFSTSGEQLEQVALTLLDTHAKTLATAESCTGGLLAKRLTDIPGSGVSFVGGAVVYSNKLKTLHCGVPATTLEEQGAVSDAVARSLAEGIRQNTGASIGIGITGVAGPDGGSPETPVGTVFIALASTDGIDCRRLNLPGDRERIRWYASQWALTMLRQHLVRDTGTGKL